VIGDDDPLAMEPEAMRRLGYAVVDRLVERAQGMRDAPVLRTAGRAELEALLHRPPPEAPDPPEAILDDLFDEVLAHTGRFDHPRFFAYIPGSGTWPAALADLVASAANIDAGEWREAAGPSQVELTVLSWFRTWLGYPGDAEGVLVSGGSTANLQALAVAREALVGPMSDRLVVYVGDAAHSSVARGARALGFRPDQVRVLMTDADHRLRAPAVAAAMDADVREGRLPFAVVAAGGTTSTGAVDPFHELAELTRERNVWLHVDAAYGGFAVLTDRGRSRLDGIELADSITLDPHKWLYMPFEVGCLMVRQGPLLSQAFEVIPEYLRDAQLEGGVNLAQRGLQLTRAARALKVWTAIRSFGVDAFRRAIDRSLDLAEEAQDRIQRSVELELVTPAELGIVTFRRRFAGVDDEDELEDRHRAVVDELAASGLGLVSSTRLRGRFVLRLCPMNHTSTSEDVRMVLDAIARMDPRPEPRRPSVTGRATESGVAQRWLVGPEAAEDGILATPLFEGLAATARARLGTASREERVAAGETVVREAEYGTLFYVVLEGRLEVMIGDRPIRALTRGDFFGENAALDWGAGYGYARTASVVAAEPSTLLAIPGPVLAELVRDDEDLRRRLRAAIRERIGSHPGPPKES
jgi:glutamate/tyrosine decarboxylase-like PLP-dependent enzyme